MSTCSTPMHPMHVVPHNAQSFARMKSFLCTRPIVLSEPWGLLSKAYSTNRNCHSDLDSTNRIIGVVSGGRVWRMFCMSCTPDPFPRARLTLGLVYSCTYVPEHLFSRLFLPVHEERRNLLISSTARAQGRLRGSSRMTKSASIALSGLFCMFECEFIPRTLHNTVGY